MTTARRPTPSIIDDVLTADATRPATIRNDAIKVDGGTQMRAQLDAATVTEYADTMAEAGWGKFPPLIAYYDGTDYWLADGFHRLAAFRSIANFSDALIPADVRSGTRRDAILHAAGANASHGLRRTNADKRRAVETLLRDDEWAKWSDREIARRCAVSDVFVGKVRGDLSANGLQIPTERTVTRNGTIYTQNTANVGAKPGLAVPPIPAPTAKEYSAAVQASQPAPGKPLTDEQVAEFLALYWRGVDLPAIADSHDPRAMFRGMLVSYQLGGSGGRWRYQTARGRVECWDGGNYHDRLPDAVWSYDQFAKLSMSILPERSRSAVPLVDTSARSADRQRTVDVLPPSDAPLPSWADEPAPDRIVGYSVLDDIALRERWKNPATLMESDGRILAARALITLYRETIATENQYGALTGQFSDWLAPKRELLTMIGHLEHLIAIIEHPEEAVSE